MALRILVSTVAILSLLERSARSATLDGQSPLGCAVLIIGGSAFVPYKLDVGEQWSGLAVQDDGFNKMLKNRQLVGRGLLLLAKRSVRVRIQPSPTKK